MMHYKIVELSVNVVKILRVGLFPDRPITINHDWERQICCHFANYSWHRIGPIFSKGDGSIRVDSPPTAWVEGCASWNKIEAGLASLERTLRRVAVLRFFVTRGERALLLRKTINNTGLSWYLTNLFHAGLDFGRHR